MIYLIKTCKVMYNQEKTKHDTYIYLLLTEKKVTKNKFSKHPIIDILDSICFAKNPRQTNQLFIFNI